MKKQLLLYVFLWAIGASSIAQNKPNARWDYKPYYGTNRTSPFTQGGIITEKGEEIGCAHDKMHDKRMATDADYRSRYVATQEAVYQIVKQQLEDEQRNKTSKDKHKSTILERMSSPCTTGGNSNVLTIPVVVHVMHLPGTTVGTNENISDAQIQAGIQHLNDAFRNIGAYAGGPFFTNAGIPSVDVEIQFCLASRDPNGNSTTGINRVATTMSNLFSDDIVSGSTTQDDALKALSFWNSNNYMNVWLVNGICLSGPTGCGTTGYAYYANAHGAAYDGIVNQAYYWGSSANNSKTHIHEVGHYLNLSHTFNDPDGGGALTSCDNSNCLTQGDYVSDTPPDAGTTSYSCSTSQTANTCSTDANDTSPNNPFTTDVQDIYEDYMDYGSQSCQNTFTPAQKIRMRAALLGIRSSLLSSEGCIPVVPREAGITNIVNPNGAECVSPLAPIVAVKNYGTAAITSLIISYQTDGGTIATYTWIGSLAAGASTNITLPNISFATGSHTFYAYISDVNGTGADTHANNDNYCVTFLNDTVTTFPYCENFESGNLNNWAIQNLDNSITWATYSGLNCGHGTAAFLNFYNYGTVGQQDRLVSKTLNLSSLSNAMLTFDVAYAAYYSNYPDGLQVQISTDCGETFTTTIYNKSGTTLSTASSYPTTQWFPTTCPTDWRTENINLSAYAGSTIIISFTSTNASGNNLFIDNICVTQCTTLIGSPCNDNNPNTINDIVQSDCTCIGTLIQAQDCANLFFSEYVEGSNNNKALAIYNPTNQAIDLSTYKIIRWSNGNATYDPAYSVILSGTIAPYDEFVVVLDKQDCSLTGQDTCVFQGLKDAADLYVSPNYAANPCLYHNGDDALSLNRTDAANGGAGTFVDIFGFIGEDPGQSWTNVFPYTTSAGGADWTKDRTCIRKASIKQGRTTQTGSPLSGAWNPSAEWDTLPMNTFDHLGYHVCDCGSAANCNIQFSLTESSNTNACESQFAYATYAIYGGIAPYQVLYSPDNYQMPNDTTITFYNIPHFSSNYVVIGDAQGCSDTLYLSVVTCTLDLCIAQPQLTYSGGNCGTNLQLNVSGACWGFNCYHWYKNGELMSTTTTPSFSVPQLEQANNFFTVIVDNFCYPSATSDTLSLFTPILEIGINSQNPTCGLSNGSLTAVPTGGANYAYQWSIGGTNATINNQPAGTYSVTVTSVGGCATVASATLTQANIGSPCNDNNPNTTNDVITATCICQGTPSTPCQAGEQWTQYTNVQEVRATAAEGNFIWIGTSGGLVKLNKTTGESQLYSTLNSELPSNYVNAIAIDTSGNKWIGTGGSRLAKFDGTTWTIYNSPSIATIVIDANGDKWIGSHYGGLAKFDGTTWTTYNTANSGLPNNTVRAIAIDASGNKWIGTGGGLAKFDGTTWTTYNTFNSNLPNNYVSTVAIDASGNKWIGTNGGGLAKFDGITWNTYNTANSGLSCNGIHIITIDISDNKWIGTNGYGLAKFDGTTWTTYNTANSGLPHNRVYAIAIDVSSNKWIGTNGGLAKFDGTTWNLYNSSNSGLSSSSATAITIDSIGNKWVGTFDEGLCKFDGTTWTTYNSSNSGLADNSVQAITIDANDNKWIGTSNGLAKFDGITWTTYNTANSGLADNSVQAIAIDANDNKWIGTYSGLTKFDGTTWTTYNTANSGLPNNTVYAITIDANDNKWIGTYSGLTKFDGTTWTTYNTANSGLPINYVNDIAIDATGNKWIGTNGGGLAKFDNNTWTTYNTYNSGLPSGVDGVNAIAIDATGNKWIGTYYGGLAKFDGTTWTTYNTDNSGLPYDNIRAIAIDENANKWIGTDGGIGVLSNATNNCPCPILTTAIAQNQTVCAGTSPNFAQAQSALQYTDEFVQLDSIIWSSNAVFTNRINLATYTATYTGNTCQATDTLYCALICKDTTAAPIAAGYLALQIKPSTYNNALVSTSALPCQIPTITSTCITYTLTPISVPTTVNAGDSGTATWQVTNGCFVDTVGVNYACASNPYISCLQEAQPTIEWQKSLGGSNNDYGYSAKQTPDGGYIVAGTAASTNFNVTGNHGGNDYWVVKLNAAGSIVWQKTYGGTDDDDAKDIQLTPDGGYIVAGSTYSTNGDITLNNGQNDYWVVKLDSNGNIVWQKTLGGESYDYAESITQTNDGGYAIAGYSFSVGGNVTGNHGFFDYWIVKLDSNGNLVWQNALGGTDVEEAYSIRLTTDNGFIVAGSTYSPNSGNVTGNHGTNTRDYWIVKLNAAGGLVWQKTLGGTISDAAYDVQQTTDGGYIVAGYTLSNDGDVTNNHGSLDYWIVKLDNNGNLIWQKALGGSSSDWAYSIAQTTDGGFVVTGYTSSNNGDVTGNNGAFDYSTMKLDANGNLVWQKSLGSTDDDTAFDVLQTTDGGYLLTGSAGANGGNVTGNHGFNDYWIVKLAAPELVTPICEAQTTLPIIANNAPYCTDSTLYVSAANYNTDFCYGQIYLLCTATPDSSILAQNATGIFNLADLGITAGNYVVVALNYFHATLQADTLSSLNQLATLCANYQSISIAVQACTPCSNPLTPNITGNTTICQGSSTTLNAGAGYATYLWNNGATTQTINALTFGNYAVVVTDANGCTGNTQVSVTIASSIILNATSTNGSCSGNNGTATVTANGSSNYTYLWSNSQTTQTINNLSAGTYTVTVTSGICNATASVIISTGNLTPTITGVTTICAGDGTTLDAGAGYTAYAWSNSGGSGQTTTFNNITATTTYTVTVTGTGGCTASDTHQVIVTSLPTVTDPADQTLCAGTSTAAVNFSGTAGATFNWTNNTPSIGLAANGTGNIAAFTANNATVSPVTATITVTPTVAGCPGTAQTFTITVNPLPTVTDPADQTLCAGSNTSAITFSGTAGATFDWTNNTTSIGLTANGTGNIGAFAASNAGTSPVTASITVTPSIGSSPTCVGTPQTFTITVNPLVTPTLSVTPTTMCATDGPITLNTTQGSGITGVWSGSGVSGNSFDPIGLSGSITLTFTANPGQCANNNTINITVTAPTSVPLTPLSSPICDIAPPISLATAQSGVVGIWSGAGVSSNNFDPSGQNGTITLTFTPDAGQCRLSSPVDITVNTALPVTLQSFTGLCSLDADVNLPATQGGISGAWSGLGVSGNSFDPSGQSGSITLTFTPSGTQCALPNTTTINVQAAPIVSLTTTDTTLCTASTINLSALLSNNSNTNGSWVGTGVFGNLFDASQVTAGTYQILYIVMPSGACGMVSDTLYIHVGTPLTPNITGSLSFCQGSSTTLNAGAGYAGYIWSNTTTNQTISVNTAGTYTVTVTNANGCTATASTTVTVNDCGCAITLAYQAINPTCNGANDGNITLTPTGGSGVYVYTWFPSISTSNVANNVSAGTYLISVADANDATCTASQLVVVNNGTGLTASINPIVSCNSNTLDLSVNGVGSYTYTWSGGLPNIQDPSNVAAGTYTVTVSNISGGCSATASASITQPIPITVDITGNTAICSGAATSLDAGIGFAAYAWNTGSIAQNITVNAEGTYTVTVTNANGCTGTDAVSITTSPNPIPNITGNTAICSGNSTSLDAGSGFAAYTWNTGSIAQNITVNAAGTYTVTVTNASGCTGTDAVIITTSPNPTPNITGNTAICSGASTSLDAGSGFAAYAWNTGNITQNIIVNTTGTYTVTVTDANGCTATDAVSITTSPNPTPDITGNTTICLGASTNLDAGIGFAAYTWNTGSIAQNITVNAAGTYIVTVTNANGCTGTDAVIITTSSNPTPNITGNTAICSGSSTNLNAGAGFTAYAWNTGSIAQNITVNAAGTYTVTVTNASGCTGTDDAIITTSPNPTPNITGNTAICSGESTNLNAGSGFAAYTWNTGSIAQNITVNAAGTYTVTVTNANGCTGTDAVIITTSPNPTPNITGNTAICSGASTNLDAGNGFAVYAWNTGSIAQNITVNAAGTYTVTVTNANGCTGTDDAIITTSPNPTPNITGNTAICSGESTNLNAGSGFAAYTWNTGSIAQNITVNAAGTYTVTVTNTNGCTGTDDAIITTSPNPTPNITGNTAICSGASTNLDAGAGYAAYAWNTGSIAQNITVNAAGTYTVTVTNANGCIGTDAVILTVQEAPIISFNTSDTTICSAAMLNLSDLLTDNSFNTGTWVGTGVFGNMFDASQVASGTYEVLYVIMPNGACGMFVDTLLITVANTPLSPIITGNLSVCEGSATILDASSIEYIAYIWSSGETTPNITTAAAGDYSVTVTNTNGCTGSAVVSVTVNSILPNAVTTTPTVCEGSTIELQGSGGVAYSWTGPNGFSSLEQNPSIASATLANQGTYTLVVIDSIGCTSQEASVVVTVQAAPIINLSLAVNSLCSNAVFSLSDLLLPNSTQGGVWVGEAVFGDLFFAEQVTAGSHTVSYVIAADTSGICPMFVGEANLTVVPPIEDYNKYCVPTDAGYQVSFNLMGGTAPYSINGVAVVSGETYVSNVLTSETYSLLVTDANGCSTFVIGDNDNCNADCATVSTGIITADDDVCGFSVFLTNAPPPIAGQAYAFSIDGTTWQNTDVFTDLAAGTYNVYVQHSCGTSIIGSYTAPETCEPVGIAAINELLVKIYPNPTSGIINIESAKATHATIIVYDAIGQIVTQRNTHFAQKETLDLSNNPAGVYLVTIKTANDYVVKKIVLN